MRAKIVQYLKEVAYVRLILGSCSAGQCLLVISAMQTNQQSVDVFAKLLHTILAPHQHRRTIHAESMQTLVGHSILRHAVHDSCRDCPRISSGQFLQPSEDDFSAAFSNQGVCATEL